MEHTKKKEIVIIVNLQKGRPVHLLESLHAHEKIQVCGNRSDLFIVCDQMTVLLVLFMVAPPLLVTFPIILSFTLSSF